MPTVHPVLVQTVRTVLLDGRDASIILPLVLFHDSDEQKQPKFVHVIYCLLDK